MFAHAEAAGQKEYDHRIQWGHQQSMLKQDPSMETPAINLIGYKTTQEEMFALYQEGPVEWYCVIGRQRKRSARRSWIH